MFIFYHIGSIIGDMIKLAIIFILVMLYFSFSNSDDSNSFSLKVEPVYTEKHKPSGLIVPKHDPRIYREIQ